PPRKTPPPNPPPHRPRPHPPKPFPPPATPTVTAIVIGPLFMITKTHVGCFQAGQQGVFTVTVKNTGDQPTSGLVTVVDTLPTGLTLVSASGTGWTCSGPPGPIVTCTRSDPLQPGASYPAITLRV